MSFYNVESGPACKHFNYEKFQLLVKMSDEEHQFESKADAGASKTYPQQAGTIRKNGYIVIKGRPCKVFNLDPFVFFQLNLL